MVRLRNKIGVYFDLDKAELLYSSTEKDLVFSTLELIGGITVKPVSLGEVLRYLGVWLNVRFSFKYYVKIWLGVVIRVAKYI